ncbi:MAG TPA: mechanosensitive ion channel family protein [Methanothermococcus okinawensis]|uniref:Mechanosensitive ion channel family protein n=1 Tax=Methanothermococcus okinawensis TaxID=155863 RepID=A0A832ZZ90_9EURY|nr:mechanosensitive ion channel family protein [Methanothermococcus okinawensis]
MEVLNITYYNNTLYQYLVFLLFLLLGILLTKIYLYLVKRYLRDLVNKSRIKFDDILLEALEYPGMILIFITCVYLGLKFLTLPPNLYTLLDNAVKVIVILCFTWFAVNLLDDIVKYYIQPVVEESETKFDDQLLSPLKKLLKIVVVILGILTALKTVGYDITALLAGLGIGGLAVALAAQDTIKNFIAGIIIFVDKPFRIKDWIKFEGGEGIVEDIGVRSTKIRTFNDSLIVVPNTNLVNANIENLSEMRKRRVLVYIGLTYDTPVEKIKRAKEIIREIVESHPGTLPPVRITFHRFNTYSLDLRVEYFIRNFGFDYYLNTIDEINLKIKEAFEKEGIEMAFPTEVVYVKMEDKNN